MINDLIGELLTLYKQNQKIRIFLRFLQKGWTIMGDTSLINQSPDLLVQVSNVLT